LDFIRLLRRCASRNDATLDFYEIIKFVLSAFCKMKRFAH
jgi:hypothetical protein